MFKGALLKRTANQRITDGVQTTLDWESEVYDTDGFADLGAQPTPLTIPAGKGITRVQVLCGVQWAASPSGDRWVEILKNGAEVDGMPGYLGPTDGSNPARIALTSAPIAVSDGDYFECLPGRTAAPIRTSKPTLRPGSPSWLEFAAFRGALVRRRYRNRLCFMRLVLFGSDDPEGEGRGEKNTAAANRGTRARCNVDAPFGGGQESPGRAHGPAKPAYGTAPAGGCGLWI